MAEKIIVNGILFLASTESICIVKQRILFDDKTNWCEW